MGRNDCPADLSMTSGPSSLTYLFSHEPNSKDMALLHRATRWPLSTFGGVLGTGPSHFLCLDLFLP